MILSEGGGHWQVALLSEQPAAKYVARAAITRERDARMASTAGREGPSAGQFRAVVEVYQRVSGHPQRALLGAEYTGSDGNAVRVKVLSTGQITRGEMPSCPSQLGGPLVPGLPSEFADPVLDALLAQDEIVSGSLVVDRAAFDEIASSAQVFRKAAEVLAIALQSADAFDLDRVRRQMRSW